MLVKLKRPWFKKGFRLFEPNKYGTEVPDSLADILPSDAEVLEGPAAPDKTSKKKSGKAARKNPDDSAPPPEPEDEDEEEEPDTLGALAKKQAEAEDWFKKKSK